MGSASGLLYRKSLGGAGSGLVDLNPRTVNIIALTITFVWATSFLADIILKEAYDPSPYVHLIMMSLVGSALSRNFLKKGNDDR